MLKQAAVETRDIGLSEKQRAALEKLMKGKLATELKKDTIPRREIHSPVPLSFSQQRLWVLDRMVPMNPFYNIPSAFHLTVKIDLSIFEKALNEVVRRHESLRTVFTDKSGEPQQVILPELKLNVNSIDLGNLPQEAQQDETTRIAAEEVGKPFDLEQGPLVRVTILHYSPNEYTVLFTMHHIISDGWSMGVFIREMTAIYTALAAGHSADIPQPPIQYADYAVWQRRWMQGGILEKQLSFWRELLSGELPILEFPVDRQRPAVPTYRGGYQVFELSPSLTLQLNELNRVEQCSSFMSLLTAFNIILYRYSGQKDIMVGSPIANRTRPELEEIIGYFANTLAFRTDLSGRPTFRELLNRVRAVTSGAYDNQDLPFEKLVEEFQPDRYMSHTPLFQVMFNHGSIIGKDNSPRGQGTDITNLAVHNRTAKFDLSLTILHQVEMISGGVEYNTDIFEDATITRFIENLKTLLAGIVACPDERIDDLPVISEEEKIQILSHCNGAQRGYHRQCLHHFFEIQVDKVPDRVALVGAGAVETLRATSLQTIQTSLHISYGQLNQQSDQLAGVLIEKGVLPDDIIGIMIDRTVEPIIGILGILKSGCAYLPIDPKLPQDRIDYMLKDSGTRILINKSEIRNPKFETNSNVQIINDQNKNNGILFVLNLEHLNFGFVSCFDIRASNLFPSNLAYVIYTSGSTGRPKGVLVEHAAVVNLVLSRLEQFTVDHRDRVLQFSSLSFDASVEQVFIAFSGGAVLVMIDENTLLDPGKFTAYLAAQSITHLDSTPSFLSNVNFESNKGLKRIVSGGEACPVSLAQQLSGYCDFYNQYGPTETTVTALAMKYKKTAETRSRIPVGMPIANTVVYLFDPFLKIVPIGVIGELYIGGEGVSRGYLNNPEITDQKFLEVSEPFFKKVLTRRGQRFYKTGDLARGLADGNLEYLGRGDQQVKIRGFRIELEEIERRLLKHPDVKEAVVLMMEHAAGDNYLCAYIVPGNEAVMSGLREYLAEQLPDYMIPPYFIVLERIPLTPNGKINRGALPKPELKIGENYIAPRNEIEKKLVELWAGVLNIEKNIISVDSSFFQLGGHSLKAVQLVSILQKDFEVSLKDIFQHQTISSLAGILSYKKSTLQQKIEELKRRVKETIPEQEIMNAREKIESQRQAYREKIEKYRDIDLSGRIAYQSILLTGATGYLGIHLLEQLLNNCNAHIYLLIRGKSHAEAEQRLVRKIKFYFNETLYEINRSRIHIVNGDISSDRFGLLKEEYTCLSEKIDCIINSAAFVKHYGFYNDFLQVNVEGLRRLIDFAFTGEKKDLNHISTLSVGFGKIKDEKFILFSEFDHNFEQYIDNHYLQSKIMGEKLIEEAREKGLNASIFRVGNLVFQSGTGRFQENIADNAFYSLFQSFIKTGIIIESDLPAVDFSFIDQAGKAVVLLYDRQALQGETHHIFNPNKVSVNELAGMLGEFGVCLRTAPVDVFLDLIQKNYEHPDLRKYIEKIILFTNLFSESDRTFIETISEKTGLILNRMGFEWPRLNKKHMEKMVSYCKEIGFI